MLAAAAVVAVLALLLVVPRVVASPALPASTSRSDAAVGTDATALDGDLPVLGEGPLVRVVRLEHGGGAVRAHDPVSGAVLRELSAPEAAAVAGAEHAVERHGYSTTDGSTLSLTFDDGPDPRWTPRLLDLLAREGVPATFFVTGEAAARHPEIVQRMVREGHAVANHSLTHTDLDAARAWRAQLELVLTDRVVRDAAAVRADYYRPPYFSDDDRVLRATAPSVLRAQRLGYAVAGYDFDSRDWAYASGAAHGRIPLPLLDGQDTTVLLHDAGGDRQRTLEYVERLVDAGRTAGYTFTTMPQAVPALAAMTGAVAPTAWDQAAWLLARALFVWPDGAVDVLLVLAVATVVLTTVLNSALALLRRLRATRRRAPAPGPGPELSVSVLVAAYNEERVIERTLRCLLDSRYADLEIVVVDDGSVDGTRGVVEALARQEPRLRLVHQANAGKAAALNHGLALARGEVVVSLDADTLFTPTTVPNLVRHFADDADGTLGAVAGVVKVGNARGLLSRWQAMEYVTSIGVDRAAQDVLGAIMVVPGACAAWRASAVRAVGGYSHDTLAEDFDLSLAVQRAGYRITQDDEAVCLTEAPETVGALAKQRLRWTFGSLQVLWKQRSMVANPRYGWLGLLSLPMAVASTLVPLLLLPLVAVLTGSAVASGGGGAVLLFAAVLVLAHLATTALGVALLGERWTHLLVVPVHRLVYEPLRAYVLYRSAWIVLRGTRLGWNKLQRTGAVVVAAPRAALAPVPGQGTPRGALAAVSATGALEASEAAAS